MKRWLVLIPIVVLLGGAVATQDRWLKPLWELLRDQSAPLEGLGAVFGVIGAVLALVGALWAFLRGRDRKPRQEAAEPAAPPPQPADPAPPPSPAVTEPPVSTPGSVVSAQNGSVSIGGSVRDGSLIVIGDHPVIHPPAASPRDEPEPRAPEPPPVDLDRVRRSFLEHLADRHRYLELKGMGVHDKLPLRLPLLELYVPLLARPELPPGETWERDGKAVKMAGRELSAEDAERLERRLSEPRRVLELLAESDGLVVLGDPGSGKTTFLKYLAVTLALGRGDELGLGDRLPVLVPLSAFSHELSRGDVRLDDFVGTYFHGLGCEPEVSGVIAEALRRGRTLLLLDGLDEVRETALRQTVARRVADFFSFHRKAGNRFVMSSRIVGYREVRTVTEGLAECTLVDFEEEEIADFVGKWTAALERQAAGETVAEIEAERERGELLAAVERNAGVRRLAANPLLLTILALMKRQGVALPERRAELYDQYVRTLLSTWNRARGLGRPPDRDLDVVETERVLAPLARWMHEVDPGLGLVQRRDLLRKLESILAKAGEKKPEARAHSFLEDVHKYSGLLLERGPGEYGFIHLTFEEYLAAVAIALDAQGDHRRIAERLIARIDDPAWREVSLLLIGYLGLIQRLNAVAGKVLERLVRDRSSAPGQAVLLAGEALLDVGETGVTSSSREKVISGLVRTLQSGEVEPRGRRSAGLILGRLGWRPEDLEVFVEVPPGPFLYGDGKEERMIEEPYWVARYPVTNAQFDRFVEDGGYRRRELWSDEGWSWKEKEGREGPADYGEERTNPIFPRAGVTFYEAEAYCRWRSASAEGFEVAGRDEPLTAGSVRVRLPSEEEWERAARGVDGRTYPWGETFEIERANTEESDLEKKIGIGTTAVCTYPRGRNALGLWDLSGNVLEWTGMRQGPAWKLCGGSYLSNKEVARCAARFRFVPGFFHNVVGFRCVLSLANSES